MKTKKEIKTEILNLTELIENMLADLGYLERNINPGQDDYSYDQTEMQIDLMSHKILIHKTRLNALKWVLKEDR